MKSLLRLNAFKIYNLLLIFVFSVIASVTNLYPLLYLIFYCFFHFIIIYLGIYYYRKILYLIFFTYGIFLDIYLSGEIGPHLFIFILLLIFLNLTLKFFYNLNSFKIYILIVILQIITIISETMFAYFIINLNVNKHDLAKLLFLSIILSFPFFYLFSKIDKLK